MKMSLVKISLFVISLVALAEFKTLLQNGPIVEIKSGRVLGTENLTVDQEKPYYSFRGIPFAEVPVGGLRFEPPVIKSSWDGVWDATKDAAPCIQGSDLEAFGAEDCLYINVYTPVRPSSTCEALPTMVWIYGGGFEGGESSYEVHGPDFLLEKDLVVVTFNYRLGFWGFLSTEDDVVPGNNGLKDQLLALKWVKENIRNFCGNPDDITLAGQSAGSASVSYHLLSPQSQGLFNRAILQSGVALSLWGYSRSASEVTYKVAKELGIDASTSREIVEGLRQVNATFLQTTAASIISSTYVANNPRNGFAIGPTIEHSHSDAFVTGKSHQALSNGNFAKVPILIGFNSLEGSYDVELAFRLFLVQFDLYPEKLLPIDMNIPDNQQSAAGRELKSFYFGWVPVSLSSAKVLEFLSDDQFVRSIREFGRLAARDVPVYFYRFSYEGGLWGIYNRTTPGATHSEELGYYWRSNHAPSSPHDLVVRSRMVSLISNFIKYGNPTPQADPVLQNVIWNQLGNDLTYLDIGKDLVLSQQPQKSTMDFWDSFYNKYGNPPYNTY